MRGRIGSIVAAGALAVVTASCVLPISDLGGARSVAGGVDDTGVIVGLSELAADPGIELPTKRLPDGTVIQLDLLPGGTTAAAFRSNSHGVVIGYGNASVSAPSERAIRWDDDGRALDLGSFGGRGWSEARDINDAGLIVGNSSTDDSVSRAFVFDPVVGHIAELASLPGGGASYVLGLNDDGLAVGYQRGSDGFARPVLWDVPAGTATDLTSRTGPALPTAINDEGTILVLVPNGPNGILPDEIALLEPGASLQRVGPTSAGCLPIDINDQDVVVGYCYTGGPRAFRWDRASGMVDLAPGHPSFAWGINNAGTIVGSSDNRAVIFVVLPDDENPGGSAVAPGGEGRDPYDSPFDPPGPMSSLLVGPDRSALAP